MPFRRRTFLSTAAKAALAVPFLRAATARAQTPPRRLVFFFVPDGVHHPDWVPTGSGTSFGFAPGSVLSPLENNKNDLIVVQGCHLTTSGTHEHGTALLLTGAGRDADVGGGASVDRYIGEELRAGTRFNQMSLGIAANFQASSANNILYSAGGTPQPPEDNPAEVYGNLFDAAAPPADAPDWRRTRLALTRAELDDLKNRVGTRLAGRLEVHAEALDALQQQYTPAGPQQPLAACEPFALQDYEHPGSYYPLTHHVNDNFPAVAKNQRDLLVATLGCDATRVASIQYSHSVSPTVFSWVNDDNGAAITEGHHSLSHTGEGDFGTKTMRYRAVQRWVTEEFRTFIEQLKAWPDPLGEGSLFDSTLVVWCSEIAGSQAHDSFNMPFVLAGGGIQGGQYLQLDDVKHNRLLVTLCAYMGLDNTTYGAPAGGNGVIPGILS